MSSLVHIRPYRAEDLPRVEALEARVQPYRPEDEAGVPAMFARALAAEQAGDPRWMAPPTLPVRAIEEEFDAFWVAEDEGNRGVLAGIVAVQSLRAGEILPAAHPFAREWGERGGVAELRRLRVTPESRGSGIGQRLSETVIAWARAHTYPTLVVNTTSPQYPALQLYRKLGFRERGISYIGRYELVWLELAL